MTPAGQGRIRAALGRAGRFLYAATRDYVIIVRGGSEGAGLQTLRELGRGGPLGWLGLAALLGMVVATAYLMLQGERFQALGAALWDGSPITAPAPALYVALGVVALAWAYLLVGAASANPWAYLVVVLYVAWHTLLIGQKMDWSFGLLAAWLLILGAWSASGRLGKGHWVYLVLLGLIIAAFTLRLSGLGHFLSRAPATLLLGLGYVALIANPWARRERRFRPELAFAVSLGLLLLYWGLAARATPPDALFQNTFSDFYVLLGIVGLFWYWMGLDLLNGAHNLADWLVLTTRSLLGGRGLRPIVMAFMALWALGVYLLLHLPAPLTMLLGRSPFGLALLRGYAALALPEALTDALQDQQYVTVALLAVGGTLAAARRLTHERAMGLLGIFLFSFFALWGYYGLFLGLAGGGAEPKLGFWPLVLFVGGIFWQMLMVSSGLVMGERSRSLLFLGFLLAVGGISLLMLATGYQGFGAELSLNTVFGVLYLGLPYELYTHLYARYRLTLVPTRQLLLLFALGMASAIPCLLLDSLLPAPLLWMGLITLAVWRGGRWDERQDGLVYALATALGFVVYYTHRVPISIPAIIPPLGVIENWQWAWELKLIYPWEARWWEILLQTVSAAALLGWGLSQARFSTGKRKVAWLAAAGLASVGLLALCRLIWP